MPYADDLRQFDEPQSPQSESGSYFPALAAISGRYQAPPPNAGLGAFMDDPFERAAYRRAGRQVGPPDRGTDADIAQAAMVMAPTPLRAVMSAPKIATAGLAAYNFLSGTDSAGGAPKQAPSPTSDPEVVQQQQKLYEAGFLRKEDIDGVRGNKTTEAEKAFNAAELQKQQLDAQKDTAQVERDKASALKLDAEARGKETERKRLADEETARRKREGDERMRDIEKNISPTSRVIRDYSGPVGIGAGMILGSGARATLKAGADYFSKRAADAGEKIMATAPTGKAAALNMSRVARIDDFWRKGGGKVPFTPTPNASPGFAVNPNATSLDKLYQPSKMNYAADLVGFGLPVGESIYADSQVKEAKAEMAKAREDYGADPSEVNIQRIQKATDNEALYTGFSNAGRIAAGAVAAGRVTFPNAKIQPGMALAEQEQLSLQKILRDASERAQKKASKSAAPEVRSMQGPVTAPPGFTGPNAHKARTLHNF